MPIDWKFVALGFITTFLYKFLIGLIKARKAYKNKENKNV